MFEELNARFKYTPEKKDDWRVMTADTGSLKGDCEDYALTALWYLSEKSWVQFVLSLVFMRYILVYATYYGTGHMVLYDPWNGRYVDNIQRRWVKKLPSGYRLKLPYLFPLNFVVWLLKRLVAKV